MNVRRFSLSGRFPLSNTDKSLFSPYMNMKSTLFSLMGGLLIATAATLNDAPTPCELARKTGGAPERLREKQHERRHGAENKQPETRLARKAGSYKTRLLYRQRNMRLHAAESRSV